MCVFCLTRYILGRGLWWNSNKTLISQCFTYLCILNRYWFIIIVIIIIISNSSSITIMTSILQCFTYLCILSCYWIIGSSLHCRSYNILWWSQTGRQIEIKGGSWKYLKFLCDDLALRVSDMIRGLRIWLSMTSTDQIGSLGPPIMVFSIVATKSIA